MMDRSLVEARGCNSFQQAVEEDESAYAGFFPGRDDFFYAAAKQLVLNLLERRTARDRFSPSWRKSIREGDNFALPRPSSSPTLGDLTDASHGLSSDSTPRKDFSCSLTLDEESVAIEEYSPSLRFPWLASMDNLGLDEEIIKRLALCLKKFVFEYIEKNQEEFDRFIIENLSLAQKEEKFRVRTIIATALCYALNVNLVIIGNDNTVDVTRLIASVCTLRLVSQERPHYQSLEEADGKKLIEPKLDEYSICQLKAPVNISEKGELQLILKSLLEDSSCERGRFYDRLLSLDIKNRQFSTLVKAIDQEITFFERLEEKLWEEFAQPRDNGAVDITKLSRKAAQILNLHEINQVSKARIYRTTDETINCAINLLKGYSQKSKEQEKKSGKKLKKKWEKKLIIQIKTLYLESNWEYLDNIYKKENEIFRKFCLKYRDVRYYFIISVLQRMQQSYDYALGEFFYYLNEIEKSQQKSQNYDEKMCDEILFLIDCIVYVVNRFPTEMLLKNVPPYFKLLGPYIEKDVRTNWLDIMVNFYRILFREKQYSTLCEGFELLSEQSLSNFKKNPSVITLCDYYLSSLIMCQTSEKSNQCSELVEKISSINKLKKAGLAEKISVVNYLLRKEKGEVETQLSSQISLLSKKMRQSAEDSCSNDLEEEIPILLVRSVFIRYMRLFLCDLTGRGLTNYKLSNVFWKNLNSIEFVVKNHQPTDEVQKNLLSIVSNIKKLYSSEVGKKNYPLEKYFKNSPDKILQCGLGVFSFFVIGYCREIEDSNTIKIAWYSGKEEPLYVLKGLADKETIELESCSGTEVKSRLGMDDIAWESGGGFQEMEAFIVKNGKYCFGQIFQQLRWDIQIWFFGVIVNSQPANFGFYACYQDNKPFSRCAIGFSDEKLKLETSQLNKVDTAKQCIDKFFQNVFFTIKEKKIKDFDRDCQNVISRAFFKAKSAKQIMSNEEWKNYKYDDSLQSTAEQNQTHENGIDLSKIDFLRVAYYIKNYLKKNKEKIKKDLKEFLEKDDVCILEKVNIFLENHARIIQAVEFIKKRCEKILIQKIVELKRDYNFYFEKPKLENPGYYFSEDKSCGNPLSWKIQVVDRRRCLETLDFSDSEEIETLNSLIKELKQKQSNTWRASYYDPMGFFEIKKALSNMLWEKQSNGVYSHLKEKQLTYLFLKISCHTYPIDDQDLGSWGLFYDELYLLESHYNIWRICAACVAVPVDSITHTQSFSPLPRPDVSNVSSNPSEQDFYLRVYNRLIIFLETQLSTFPVIPSENGLTLYFLHNTIQSDFDYPFVDRDASFSMFLLKYSVAIGIFFDKKRPCKIIDDRVKFFLSEIANEKTQNDNERSEAIQVLNDILKQYFWFLSSFSAIERKLLKQFKIHEDAVSIIDKFFEITIKLCDLKTGEKCRNSITRLVNFYNNLDNNFGKSAFPLYISYSEYKRLNKIYPMYFKEYHDQEDSVPSKEFANTSIHYYYCNFESLSKEKNGSSRIPAKELEKLKKQHKSYHLFHQIIHDLHRAIRADLISDRHQEKCFSLLQQFLFWILEAKKRSNDATKDQNFKKIQDFIDNLTQQWGFIFSNYEKNPDDTNLENQLKTIGANIFSNALDTTFKSAMGSLSNKIIGHYQRKELMKFYDDYEMKKGECLKKIFGKFSRENSNGNNEVPSADLHKLIKEKIESSNNNYAYLLACFECALAVKYSLINLKNLESFNTDSSKSNVGLFRLYNTQILIILLFLGVGFQSRQKKRTLAEILTGEGKSHILGVLALILATVNKEKHIVIACYDERLVFRDEASYNELIEIYAKNRIKYEKLAEICLDLIIPDPVCSALKNIARGVGSRKNKIEASIQEMNNVILLIDEVDVILQYWFLSTARWRYGDENITEYFKDNRSKCNLSIKCTFIHTKGPSALNNLKQKGLYLYRNKDNIFAKNIHFIGQEQSEGINLTMLPGAKNCLEKIKWPEGESICMEIDYELLKLIASQDETVYKFPFYLPEILYTDVFSDKRGKLDIGVSGSLSCLHAKDKEILFDRFDFNPTFFSMPSSYGTKQLTDLAKPGDEVCVYADQEEQFSEIVNKLKEIKGKEVPRAVIVFFKDTIALDLFKKRLEENSFNGNVNVLDVDIELFDIGRELNDKARRASPLTKFIFQNNETNGESKYYDKYTKKFTRSTNKEMRRQIFCNETKVIEAAGNKGQITLAIAPYARGTDFGCQPALDDQGGTLLIASYYPQDIKEEVQLKGRVARKLCKGEFQYCLLQEDLVEMFQLKSEELKNMTYRELSEKRAEAYDARLKNKIEEHDKDKIRLGKEHHESLGRVVNLLKQKDYKDMIESEQTEIHQYIHQINR